MGLTDHLPHTKHVNVFVCACMCTGIISTANHSHQRQLCGDFGDGLQYWQLCGDFGDGFRTMDERKLCGDIRDGFSTVVQLQYCDLSSDSAVIAVSTSTACSIQPKSRRGSPFFLSFLCFSLIFFPFFN